MAGIFYEDDRKLLTERRHRCDCGYLCRCLLALERALEGIQGQLEGKADQPWVADAPIRLAEMRRKEILGPTLGELLNCGSHINERDSAIARAERAEATVKVLVEALERAERKLSAYVGVCKGDKELNEYILPMARAALAQARKGGEEV